MLLLDVLWKMATRRPGITDGCLSVAHSPRYPDLLPNFTNSLTQSSSFVRLCLL